VNNKVWSVHEGVRYSKIQIRYNILISGKQRHPATLSPWRCRGKKVFTALTLTNRWQDEVTKDGRMVGGEEWQEKVYDREEWKKLLRTARNRRILHMPME
jgi:hypothetical protein